MERFFQILAVILAGVAAYFLWRGNGDGAFIAVVLGAVSFFLSVRFQVKERLQERASETEEAEVQEAENELLEPEKTPAAESFKEENSQISSLNSNQN